MNKTIQHSYLLKTGETVIFKTNMLPKEIQSLPVFSNQYEFYKYFRDRGYWIEIDLIIKKGH
ncbi:tRNA splicing endonuclease [Evansella vedderi]|uniref:tRNA splicing endonuclease n=1 Tax=Evansella vedderi TaxID=38282 RepID=A0ABT9ZTH7_9BACI|nr:tRNA splicing endonuclease [Evansella vedderi]